MKYFYSPKLPPLRSNCCRLYLCRHGETDYNVNKRFQGRGVNQPLNETGRRQAQYLAQSLENIPVDAVFSSSLVRAIQTAQIIKLHHPNVSAGEFEELDEMSFGIAEGKYHEECEALMKTVYKQWELGSMDHSWPCGESPLQVEERGRRAIETILSSNYEHVVAVAHGRFLKVLLASILEADLTKMKDMVQDNTCVNVVDFDRISRRYIPVVLNDTTHLMKKGESLEGDKKNEENKLLMDKMLIHPSTMNTQSTLMMKNSSTIFNFFPEVKVGEMQTKF